MRDERTAAAFSGGLTLLERAVNYTLGSLHAVTPEAMSRPTPCQDWDLRALLAHMDDSLTALCEAVDLGRVGIDGAGNGDGHPDDPVALLRDRACRLIGACTATEGRELVSVAGRPVTTSIVTSAGAVEIAVHGWDVARACGCDRPLPPALAEELLELSPLLVIEADRPGRFGPPVQVPPLAGPGGRLLAFLGRRP